MGSGHVMRCMTLALALRAKGADVQFVCRQHPGHMMDRLREEGFRVYGLPLVTDEQAQDWLGDSLEADAQATVATFEGRPDWVVVDHYAVDKTWEATVKQHCERLMVIDDLADRKHACDLLLDQNEMINRDARYQGLAPEACKKLLGPRYALLNPLYKQYREQVKAHTGAIKRVLVFFGGGRVVERTLSALQAIGSLDQASLQVDVIVAANQEDMRLVESAVKGQANICVHGRVKSLAYMMMQADLFIGAGGSTSWERSCLGLPSIVVSMAQNQEPICEALDRRGIVFYLGREQNVSTENIAQVLQQLIATPRSVVAAHVASLQLVDGLGVERVVSEMMA